MRLFINGTMLPVAQLGPDFLILATPPSAHPADHADIAITVDETEDRIAVYLPQGLIAGEDFVKLSQSLTRAPADCRTPISATA